jgi:hypothetical protein
VLREEKIDEGADLSFGILGKLRPSVPVEYAHCVCVDGFELGVGEGIFTGIVGLVLKGFHSSMY